MKYTIDTGNNEYKYDTSDELPLKITLLDADISGLSLVWGDIEGTLSDQTDLQDALDLKADATDIPTTLSELTNDVGYITDYTVTNDDLVGLNISNLTNNSGYITDYTVTNDDLSGLNISNLTNDSGYITDYTDEKVKYDSEDTSAGYIADKFVAGSGILLSEGEGGAENKLVIINNDAGSDAVTTHESTYNHSDIASNTSARHDAVTVTDSSEIDFTLTGQDITASIKTGSIDILKLDSDVQASLGLADSAIQDISGLVPYSGATGAVDLGDNTITAYNTRLTSQGVSFLVGGADDLKFNNFSEEKGFQWLSNNGLSQELLMDLDFNDGLDLQGLDITTTGTYYGIKDGMVLMDSNVGGRAYYLSEYIDDTQSAGWISGGEFSDDGDGTMTVASGKAILKTTNSATGINNILEFPETALSPANNTTSYVYIDYSTLSPVVSISTSNVANGTTKINLGLVFREDNDLHLFRAGQVCSNLPQRIIARFNSTGNIQLTSGGEPSEVGTRSINVSPGTLWGGIIKFVTDEINTSTGDTFEYYYTDSPSGFQYLSETATQIDNTQYDLNGTLTPLNNNRYRTDFLYLSNDGDLLVMLGTNNSVSLIDARAVNPPTSLPPHIRDFATLIGQVIVQEGATNLIEVNPIVNSTTFATSGAVIHNETTGIQGGTTDEYYHLTAAEHTIATQAATTSLDGYLSSTNFNTFNNKQDALISGTNIKTVNSTSLLGSGDVSVGTVTSVSSANTDIDVANGTTTPTLTLNSATTGNSIILKTGADGKINQSVLPSIAISETFVVASEAAQLALTVQKGDVAIRSDENKTYINSTGNNTAMSDWEQMLFPTGGSGTVTSITSGDGMNFSTITSSGDVTLGTPSTLTNSTTNGVTSTSHTHQLDLSGYNYITTSSVTYETLNTNGDVGTTASTLAAGNDSRFHDAVTVLDSSEIDFTLTGQQITASLKSGSIDETKLDTSVNDSLDLADSALQSGDNISELNNNAGYTTYSANQSLDTTNSPTFANLNVGQYLYHSGDTDTYFRFETDRIYGYAGGIEFLDAYETTTDNLSLGGGFDNISFKTNGNDRLNISDSGLQIGSGARVSTIGTTFVDNDTSLMTSQAIKEKIESYSYTTNTGTVTSVAISGSDGIEIDSGSPITTSGTIALGVNKTTMLSTLNVEDGADVTDTANVTAAGALMDSELTSLTGIKTLTVPDNTTISTFGKSLIDDDDVATARSTLDVDQAGTDNSTDVTLAGSYDYLSITGQEITLGQIDLTTDVTGNLPDGNIASATTWNAKQDALTFGIANTNAVKIDDSDAAENDYVKLTTTGLVGRSYSEVKTDLSLNNVENTAISSWTGSSNITTVGTIGTGTWQGTAISDTYISSASTWNGKQDALTFGIADTNAVKIDDTDAASNDYCKLTTTGIVGRSYSEVLTDLSLDSELQNLSSAEIDYLEAIYATGVSSTEFDYLDGVSSNIQTQLDDKVDADLTIQSKTANYTLVAGDNNSVIHCSNSITITLPDSLATGFNCTIVNVGTGTITLSASTTLRTKDSNTKLSDQYGAASVYHSGSNVWYAYGDLSA